MQYKHAIINNMTCPNCKNILENKIVIGDVSVDKCDECDGLWFDNDELRKVKDEKNIYAKWFDFDLWKNHSLLAVAKSTKICPIYNIELFTLNYGDSNIKIDACKECGGIWLDKGEFKKIIEYVGKESDLELLRHYTKNLIKEGEEIFNGPENLKSEIIDLLLLIKMFQYKFMAQHPKLAKIIMTHVPPLN